MGILVSILGKSGSGKSRSMKTLTNMDELMIIRPSRKPISFRNKFQEWNKETETGQYFYTNKSEVVCAGLKKFYDKGKRLFVIEDSTFFMTDYFMDTVMESGWDKYNINSKNYYNIIKAAENLPDDARIYLVNHVDRSDTGEQQIKTIGKMLSEKLPIAELITIILFASVNDGKHTFQTNKVSGTDICKSPEEMFDDLFIENDLQFVDDRIKWYYNVDQDDV